MCQGRHHPITTTISGKLGIAYCLLGIILLFLGCARQDDAPFTSEEVNSNQVLDFETAQDETIEMVHPGEIISVPNRQPVILSEPVTIINVDVPYVYPAIAIDPDGDQLTWFLQGTVEGINIESNTGLVYGNNISPGMHSINIRADDGRGGTSEQSFLLNVTSNPVIHSSPPGYAFNNYLYRYSISASSQDESVFIYTLDIFPSGMVIDGFTGELQWQKPIVGEHDIRINVTSMSGDVTYQDYILTVLDENSLEIVSSPELVAYELQPYHYRPSVLSVADREMTFTLIGAVSGMEIDEPTGQMTWIPSTSGIYPVELMVMDSDGRTGTQEFEIQVRSLEKMDQELNGIIQDVFDDLVAGDIESARPFLSGEFQANFLPVLNALLPYMEEIIANLGDMERLGINNTSAEYIIPRNINDERRLFIVTFVTDDNGDWKLNSL